MNEIICGNNLDILKSLPSNYVDSCVTSPPYFGLRDYGTEPIIFGGEADCEHEWGAETITKKQPQRDTSGGFGGATDVRGEQEYSKASGSTINNGSICSKCHAWKGNIGLEPTPEEYVNNLVNVFREVKRVLKYRGTLWLNLGDSYWGSGNASGHTKDTKNLGAKTSNYGATKGHTAQKHKTIKPKDLIGIPWRVAFALQADGWYLRQDIIWQKPNPMPESVKDRCTKSHEYIFLLTKQDRYHFDHEAIKEPVAESTIGRGKVQFGGAKGRAYKENIKSNDPNFRNGSEQWGRTFDYTESCKTGRNKRSVWQVTTKPFKGAHFATFPEALIDPMIRAGCPDGGIVLDPFSGAGTRVVAKKQLKNYIGIDLSEKYCEMARNRIEETKIPNISPIIITTKPDPHTIIPIINPIKTHTATTLEMWAQ